MAKDDLIVDGQESLVRAFGALRLRFRAEAVSPFVATGRRVARPARLGVFPPSREDVGATAKPFPEEMDLFSGCSRCRRGNRWDCMNTGPSQRLAQGRNLRAPQPERGSGAQVLPRLDRLRWRKGLAGRSLPSREMVHGARSPCYFAAARRRTASLLGQRLSWSLKREPGSDPSQLRGQHR